MGVPDPALARMTKPVESDSDTVVDADPADVNASACPPEALLSETIRPEPDGERAIFSSSIGVGVAIVLAVALLVALLVAVGGTAASLSRRVVSNPTAARASAGIVGALSEAVPAPVVGAVLIAGVIDALPMGDEVMGDPDAVARVADWATDVVAGARRAAEAVAADF